MFEMITTTAVASAAFAIVLNIICGVLYGVNFLLRDTRILVVLLLRYRILVIVPNIVLLGGALIVRIAFYRVFSVLQPGRFSLRYASTLIANVVLLGGA